MLPSCMSLSWFGTTNETVGRSSKPPGPAAMLWKVVNGWFALDGSWFAVGFTSFCQFTAGLCLRA